jgi:hypothetical protein
MQPNYYQQQQQQQQQGRRPTPYEQRDSYNQGRRPTPSDAPPYQPQSDPYAFAFEQLQSMSPAHVNESPNANGLGHRRAGMFYPEAHASETKFPPGKQPDIVSPRPQR